MRDRAAPGGLGAQPTWEIPLQVGGKTWVPAQAAASSLMAGVLKSKRNDSFSTFLVSHGSQWWVSLRGEGPSPRGAEETTVGRLPVPNPGLCTPLLLSAPRPSPAFPVLMSETSANCMYITRSSQHICIYTSVYIYRVVLPPFLFLRSKTIEIIP